MDTILKSTLALLFVASEPISRKQLAQLNQSDEAAISQAIMKLYEYLRSSGLHIIQHNDRYELTTTSEVAEVVAAYFGARPNSLSAAALETLAIIAYKQPIDKESIDEIRGIASDQTLRNLLSRGLIAQKQSKGKPIHYVTTAQFLVQSGLQSIDQLPVMTEENDAK